MDVATTFYNDRVIIGFEFLESFLITYRNEKKDHFNDNYNYCTNKKNQSIPIKSIDQYVYIRYIIAIYQINKSRNSW